MERKNNITSDRVYQDFEPVTRWVTEPGLDILLVSLPGFKKEQLRVQVTATRRLRLMGERLIGGNRWIRFRKEFPIQGNIDMDIISAKFEDGTLFVKHPRFKIQEPQREIHAEPRQQPPTETIDGQPQTQEITSQKQNTDIQDRNPSKPVTDSQRENEKNKSKEKAMDSETDEENKSTEEKTNKLKEKYKEKLSGLVKEAQNQKQVVKEAQNGKQMVKESDNQKQVVMNLVAAILVVLLLLLSARNAVRSFIGISDD